MRVRLKKRIFCYLLDLIIISFVGFIFSILLPKSTDYIFIQNSMSVLSENYLNSEISFLEYFSAYSLLAKDLDQNNILYMSVYFCLSLIYFIVVPLFFRGKTVGMLITKLSVKNKSDSLFKMVFIRSIVAYGILYYLLQLCILFVMPDSLYFIMLTILAIIQILVVICSAFMIKYRNDKRSLADILSNSNILIES